MKKIYLLFIITFLFSQDEHLVTIPATQWNLNEWVYYSFDSHSIVDIQNPESSLDWDIGLQRKHIRTNSGLAGIGQGGGYVDSTKTWDNYWATMDYLPEDLAWHTDETFYDFYDFLGQFGYAHTYVEGIENPALRTWGWFNANNQLVPTNYVVFARCANGEDIVKLWAYDYYDGNFGGHISIRYQTGFSQSLNIFDNNLEFNLSKAYPNPFNPVTNFEINIPKADYIKISAYDMAGRKVADIFDGIINAGKHTLKWDASNMQSGIYIIKSDYSNSSFTKKVALIK